MLSGQPVARLAVSDGRVVGVVMASGELIEARRGVILAADPSTRPLSLRNDTSQPLQ
jgi:phytoene dehydrogenase-like protein